MAGGSHAPLLCFFGEAGALAYPVGLAFGDNKFLGFASFWRFGLLEANSPAFVFQQIRA